MKIHDIVIVGAGPAGMTAAIYAIRANMSVLLLDKLAPGGQMINTNEIENYTGTGRISGAELSIKMYEHTQELGVEFDYKTIVDIRISGETKLLISEEDPAGISARTVIIATGTTPRTLGVKGEDSFSGNGISWCAICDGAQYRNKDVLVIGGGNSAVEESLYLAGISRSLTIVTMFDLTADPKACDQLRRMPNVTIYPYQEIIEFNGVEKLEGVRFKSTREDATERIVRVDGVFEYIGLQPNTGAFEHLGILDDMGFVKVRDDKSTPIDGVFAAGDVTAKKLRQVITACSDGAIAAGAAARYVERLKVRE